MFSCCHCLKTDYRIHIFSNIIQRLSESSSLLPSENMSNTQVATSTHDEWMNHRRSIQSYDTRPTTVAAREFLGVTDDKQTWIMLTNKKNNKPGFHWKTLPQRVEWLCGVLEAWVRSYAYDHLFVSWSHSSFIHSSVCLFSTPHILTYLTTFLHGIAIHSIECREWIPRACLFVFK